LTLATYDRNTIRFHWTTAALVVVLWLLGQTADWFPRGPWRGAAWSTHFTLGAILLLVYVGRVFWRIRRGRRLPGVGSTLMVKAAAAGHGLLYLGIGVVIVAGIANLFAHGSSVWGLFHYPKIADESLRHNIGAVHEWTANLLLLLAAGHAGIALVHQYVWRDGVLSRMWPNLAR
jgi:cytochrome b561